MNTKTVVIWIIVLVVLGYAIYALTKSNVGEEAVVPEESTQVEETVPAAGVEVEVEGGVAE